ncbi:MAG: methanogenesis marker 5 protein [Candidatus Syntrophoarchaeum sp.]|nr:methanogenesis marker 5 protein [Candidatus Syntrophoarchaeum sp.]
MKVLIYPPNSLILADLVERRGHEAIVLMKEVAKKVRDPELDSPPMNITEEDLKRSLKYLSVEEPSGVRGRVGLMIPLLDDAEAAIIVEDPDPSFGCMACDVANDYIEYMIRSKGIPTLIVPYPYTEDAAKVMVQNVTDFLRSLRS